MSITHIADTQESVPQALPTWSESLESYVQRNAKNPEALASIHSQLKTLKDDVKAITSDVERYLLQALNGETSMPAGERLRVLSYKEPKDEWNDNSVMEALAQIVSQHAVDPLSGEVGISTDHALRIVDVILAVLGKTHPKKQALRAHRIDPSKLLTTTWSDPKVAIVEAELSHPVATLKGVRSK